MNQSELEYVDVTCAKRGKTRASEARLGLVLLLIGWESGAWFFNQSQGAEKPHQSKREITFDTQLKTALINNTYLFINIWLNNKINLSFEFVCAYTFACNLIPLERNWE